MPPTICQATARHLQTNQQPRDSRGLGFRPPKLPGQQRLEGCEATLCVPQRVPWESVPKYKAHPATSYGPHFLESTDPALHM